MPEASTHARTHAPMPSSRAWVRARARGGPACASQGPALGLHPHRPTTSQHPAHDNHPPSSPQQSTNHAGSTRLFASVSAPAGGLAAVSPSDPYPPCRTAARPGASCRRRRCRRSAAALQSDRRGEQPFCCRNGRRHRPAAARPDARRRPGNDRREPSRPGVDRPAHEPPDPRDGPAGAEQEARASPRARNDPVALVRYVRSGRAASCLVDKANLVFTGVMTSLLQEIISVYPLLNPSQLTAAASNRVCNALALLQCVASHTETRGLFLSGKPALFFSR